MFEQALEFMQAIITCYERQKIRLHYSKEFEGPSVNYCRGNHIMFGLCDHDLCHEPILWSLVVI